jgi:hypothetical protein
MPVLYAFSIQCQPFLLSLISDSAGYANQKFIVNMCLMRTVIFCPFYYDALSYQLVSFIFLLILLHLLFIGSLQIDRSSRAFIPLSFAHSGSCFNRSAPKHNNEYVSHLYPRTYPYAIILSITRRTNCPVPSYLLHQHISHNK